MARKLCVCGGGGCAVVVVCLLLIELVSAIGMKLSVVVRGSVRHIYLWNRPDPLRLGRKKVSWHGGSGKKSVLA